MLTWFILQGNAPIGNICKDDFKFEIQELFDFIKELLMHNKNKREKTLDDFIIMLKKSNQDLLVK
jgi:hypothetical protein